MIAEEAAALGVAAPVSVRLNPDVEADTHAYVATGTAASKFGLGLPTPRSPSFAVPLPHPALEPVGISFHVGSQLLDPAPVLAAAERAAELWRELAADGIALRDLDAGGGLGVPYEGGADADVDAYATALVGARERARRDARARAGPLARRAGRDVRHTRPLREGRPGRRIAVCDGGMNDLIRPSLYGAHHPIELVGAGRARARGRSTSSGPVCESGDFFARGRELPLPEPGDLLAIGYAGAYGRVMSSTYNARPLCAEVLLEGGGWRVTREPIATDALAWAEHM